jgi:D-alanyl-D-alanine carboxypeptidase
MAGIASTPPCDDADHRAAGRLPHRFQAELGTLVARFDLPGATAAYVLPDGTIGTAAAGLADTATATPMTPDSRMLAASVGKTFVAAVVVALAHDGLLDLDDRLADHLGDQPWFGRLPNATSITLRQLLRHQAGLPDHVHDPAFHRAWQDRRLAGDAPFAPAELVAFVLDREPLFAAGEGWSYSDTGYILLGMAIEAVTGRSYEQTVTRRFLEPLALDATTPSDRPDLPGLASGYLAPDNPFGLPPVTTRADGVMAWHPGVEWTGGGLVSTSRDLAAWAHALFGGRALPGADTTTLTDGVTAGDGVSYGLGVAIRPAGALGRSWGHGGWIPGHVTSLRHYPDHGVTVAFQINTDVGLDDPVRPVVDTMERRLATLVAGATNDHDLDR